MRYSPHRAIFQRKPKHGSPNVGSQIGTLPPCVPTLSLHGSLHDAVALDGATYFIKENDVVYAAGSATVASVASIDVSNPAAPALLDALPNYPIGSSSGLSQIIQVGAYLYACSATGFTIFDPANPEITPSRFFAVTDGVIAGVVGGSYLYATSWGFNGHVYVFDISSPLTPTLVGTVTDNTLFNNVRGIAKSGNYVFVGGTGSSRFVVVDVTTPSSPSVVTNLAGATNFGNAFDVAIAGSYAYVSANSGLTVVDISTPTSPTVAGRVNSLGPLSGVQWLLKDGNTVYITATFPTAMLYVFDVTTPTAPTATGVLNRTTLGDAVSGSASLAKSGNYLFISVTNSDRIRVVDVTTPATPTSAGTLTSSTALDGTTGLFISGSTLHSLGLSQFSEIDITTPTSPTVTYTTHGDWLGGVSSFIKVGDYLLCGESQNTLGRITVIDASDPTDMVPVDSFTHANLAGVNHLASDGTYLYATSQVNDRITVLNISNPLAISYVTFITNATTLDGATYLALVGTNLYVGVANTSRLTVVDITTPATPTITGSVASTSLLLTAFGIAVSGNYAYVCALGANRLTVVDISNPASPTIVGSVRDDVHLNRPFAVAYDNGKCFVTCQTANRVTVVNVTTPTAPAVTVSIQDNTNLNRPVWIVEDDDLLYVACTLADRMTVLEYECVQP